MPVREFIAGARIHGPCARIHSDDSNTPKHYELMGPVRKFIAMHKFAGPVREFMPRQKSKQKAINSRALCANPCQKAPENTALLAPARPSEEEIVLHAPTQLRLARSHARHETKTKTKRSRFPGLGCCHKGELATPKPPI